LAGALSGLIGFAIVEPITQRSVSGTQGQALLEMACLFAIFSSVVSLGLILAEEMGSLQLRRILVRGVKGLAVGAAGGFVAGFLGQLIFHAIAVTLGIVIGEAARIPARAIGWGLVGAIVGAANGEAAGSAKKALLGLAGGLVGGSLGGLLFDPVAAVSNSDTISRVVGLTSVGLATGLAIALVEEIAKRAWIVVLAGRNEGRECILSKSVTRIGRDELADIPLFGDPNVARLHGTVESTRGGYYFRDSGGSLINNRPAQPAPLADGDIIQIGRFSLSFRTKGTPRTVRQTLAPAMQIPAVAPVQQAMPRLSVVAGPYAGRKFDIVEQNTTIGREPSNAVALEQDAGVSRRHAVLSYENGRYVVRDAGSTNGTFVSGARITEAVLGPGDTLQVGATGMVLVVE
jgi:pSer/pThr/pTyr-binding forkhead associated (FHA) protein